MGALAASTQIEPEGFSIEHATGVNQVLCWTHTQWTPTVLWETMTLWEFQLELSS